MSQEHPGIAIVFEGQEVKKLPKPTFWDWAKYYIYNITRKPAVIKKQKKVHDIALFICQQLRTDLFPSIAADCAECKKTREILRSQVYVSQIKLVLKNIACVEHREIFTNFHQKYYLKFVESEEISRWINGFK